MAWQLSGTYFENCSCDAVCPCTWSSFGRPATLDRCRFFMALHIERGEVEGVDVSGLTFGLIGDTPAAMAEGNWKMGAYIDETADDAQREKLGAVISGSLGGPPAVLGPLIGEFLGVTYAPIEFESSHGRHRVAVGPEIAVEVEEYTGPGAEAPARIQNVTHPANSTLTVAPAVSSRISGFGITFEGEGRSGFAAPFNWSA